MAVTRPSRHPAGPSGWGGQLVLPTNQVGLVEIRTVNGAQNARSLLRLGHPACDGNRWQRATAEQSLEETRTNMCACVAVDIVSSDKRLRPSCRAPSDLLDRHRSAALRPSAPPACTYYVRASRCYNQYVAFNFCLTKIVASQKF